MPWFTRVRDILLHPRRTWPQIEAEGSDEASICRSHLIGLATLSAVAGFVGATLIGFGGHGIRVQMPLATGLVQLVASIGATLLGVWLVSLAVDAMAPRFGGVAGRVAAFKLIAYGSTAWLVSDLAALVPNLDALELLGGAYSVYLIYSGLPVLMACPPEKAGLFTAAIVACGIVTILVITGLLGGLLMIG